MNNEIEFVARALYAVEDDAQNWDLEPEIIKEEFRRHARAALVLLAQHRIEELSRAKPDGFPYAA